MPNLGRVCLIFTKIAFFAGLSTINLASDGILPRFGRMLFYNCMKRDEMKDVLNDEQKAAVACTEGTIRVVAGAGSGKTRTLAHRYAMLMNEMGIPQSDILCMTFTNKAAQEMKARISMLCPSSATGDFVTTIHGFCVKFLREEIYRLGYPENFLIYDEEDMKAIVKEVLEENGIERKNGIVGNYVEELAQFKAETPYIPRFILPLGKSYEDTPLLGRMILRQRRYFALDFNDLMFFTLHLLNFFPEVREKWQKQFQYVMVDEVQDCSKVEWELFTILSERYGNLFIVGDGDQAIYEWRGAHPELLINYSPEHEFCLKQNYRSQPNIVCVADCIIGRNKNRLPRTSVTMRPAGERTKYYHCKNELKEAETLARELKKLRSKSELFWKDMAILYRASYLSRGIEQTFIREKIPYAIWGGVRFFERKEIKDALCYLRLVALDDDMSFKRIANVPSRKIGKKTMAYLKGYASSIGCSLFSALAENLEMPKNPKASAFVTLIREAREHMGKSDIAPLLESLLECSGLMAEYRADTEEERLENLQELLKTIRTYEEENREEEDLSVQTYLQDIALYTNADYQKDDDKVKLMTIHQAKGLEFPLVWIYGLNEGVMPSHRTIRERGEAGLEEERRLMYVACTRAMDRLIFSDSEGFNVQTSLSQYPSRFIREAKDDFDEYRYYDIVGDFDICLWRGTDRLIASLEKTMAEGDAAQAFPIGSKVHHAVFGNGEVLRYTEDGKTVIVQFQIFGERRLKAESLAIAGQSNC